MTVKHQAAIAGATMRELLNSIAPQPTAFGSSCCVTNFGINVNLNGEPAAATQPNKKVISSNKNNGCPSHWNTNNVDNVTSAWQASQQITPTLRLIRSEMTPKTGVINSDGNKILALATPTHKKDSVFSHTNQPNIKRVIHTAKVANAEAIK